MRHDGLRASEEAHSRRSPPAGSRRRRGGRGLLDSALHLSLALLLLSASPGCSLILTKGPEPEVHPPPECTSSVVAPVADTILAAAAVTLAIAVLATGCSSSTGFGNVGCGIGQGVGTGVGVGSGALALLFGVSAGFGYTRTSACRASLGPGYVPPPPTQLTPVPEASLWPPPRDCLAPADAPRVCALATPSGLEWAGAPGTPR